MNRKPPPPKIDLTGEKFGLLTVKGLAKKQIHHQKKTWECVCDCGTTSLVATSYLTTGNTKSCGCNQFKNKDLTGKKFGRLLVLSLLKRRTNRQERQWKCLCDCGETATAITKRLIAGTTKSCGCIFTDRMSSDSHPMIQRQLEKYGTTVSKRDPAYKAAAGCKDRARQKNIEFGFDSISDLAIYIREITPKVCPVFKKPLANSERVAGDFSPSTDRIVPSKGYVKGNIQVISNKANTMKSKATPKELDQFSIWHLTRRGYVVTKQCNTVTS